MGVNSQHFPVFLCKTDNKKARGSKVLRTGEKMRGQWVETTGTWATAPVSEGEAASSVTRLHSHRTWTAGRKWGPAYLLAGTGLPDSGVPPDAGPGPLAR